MARWHDDGAQARKEKKVSVVVRVVYGLLLRYMRDDFAAKLKKNRTFFFFFLCVSATSALTSTDYNVKDSVFSYSRNGRNPSLSGRVGMNTR